MRDKVQSFTCGHKTSFLALQTKVSVPCLFLMDVLALTSRGRIFFRSLTNAVKLLWPSFAISHAKLGCIVLVKYSPLVCIYIGTISRAILH